MSDNPPLRPGNFWYSEQGNMLKGVEGDPLNPLRLTVDLIVGFMQGTKKAREDFPQAFQALNEAERKRISDLVSTYNLLDPPPVIDPIVIADTQERYWNMGIPVRTDGRLIARGGGYIPLPPDLILKKDRGV